MQHTVMSDQVPLSSLRFLPLQAREFHSLPAGFEYQHEISEGSNTTAFDTGIDARDLRRCVVCGMKGGGGLRPGVQRAHIIGRTEDILWGLLKGRGFVPSFAKSVVHEPRNGINLCSVHHVDFDGYRFFIRWVPSLSAFVFINFSQNGSLEQFHGKTVALDPNHSHSPFTAPFLIQEMRTRGFHPWCTDRSIPCPLSPTYTDVDNGGGDGVAGFGGAIDTGVESGGMAGPGGSGGVAGSSSGPSSTGVNQQYLVLGNPFQDPELLESMRRQWQQLPNWKSATVEGLTWEGTAEENAKQYVDLVGVSPH
ncbi:hypothetical protein FIBSPDRAFT_825845 [Athelia psychrophila]|uniref:HNH nuclease domain-containing protein n=1 Tax=Athelia psychrophila TaxID=1759441 RepID=A0A166JX39_9AGAM|nr:hypothetical protein FIBSPDRAFT_825845 [Fibularhizoctonia sp. CBS 109695]